jgi:glycosyltransferase involved in cell wall biosynthesis
MLKICLIGHIINCPDEGVVNLARLIGLELAKRNRIIGLNISDPFLFKKVRDFHPDIIHYIISPNTGGLAIARFISWLNPAAKTLVSAPHPAGIRWGPWMHFLKSGTILAQSNASEQKFRDWGFKTHFLPNGVDVTKFVPVDAETKRKLRQKYQVPPEKFVILHVASIKRGRNLQAFKNLRMESLDQVLIVGRIGEKRDEELRRELENCGYQVMIKYFPNIEEIYALSDCYVFTTLDSRYCIETPLSVLEAMSCNLPVITTPFGSLPRIFNEGDGFIFARQESDFQKALDEIKSGKLLIKTREKVLPYSWEKIVGQLVELYEQLSI